MFRHSFFFVFKEGFSTAIYSSGNDLLSGKNHLSSFLPRVWQTDILCPVTGHFVQLFGSLEIRYDTICEQAADYYCGWEDRVTIVLVCHNPPGVLSLLAINWKRRKIFLNRRIAYLCETAYARQIPFFKTGASSSRLFLRRKTETDRKHEEELKKLITIFSSFFFVKVAPFEGNAGSMLLQFFSLRFSTGNLHSPHRVSTHAEHG